MMTDFALHFNQVMENLLQKDSVHWYNINPQCSSTHDLWDVFGLSPHQFEHLLMKLKWLQVRTSSNGQKISVFRPRAIEEYIRSHYEVPYKVDYTKAKPKVFGVHSHFLRIGAYQDGSFNPAHQFDQAFSGPSNPPQQLPMPEVSYTDALRSSLTLSIEAVRLEEECKSLEQPQTVVPTENELKITLQRSVFSRLTESIQASMATLPLEDLTTLKEATPETLVWSFSETIMKKRHQFRAERNAAIFGSQEDETIERTNTPKLDQYHVPNDSREHELLLQELVKVHLQRNPSKFVAGNLYSANNTSRNLIIVPKNKTLRVNQLLVTSLLQCSEMNMALLLKACRNINEEEFLSGLRSIKMAPPNVISTDQLAALMQAMNLSQRQMRTLRRLLHHWLYCKVFPSEQRMLHAYKDDGYAPYTDVTYMDSRKYHYSYKLPDELLEFHIVRYVETLSKDEVAIRKIKRIELVILADHGKGHFRTLTSLLLYNEHGHLIYKTNMSTGNVQTTEDTVRMMRETFVSKVNDSLQLIGEAKNVVIRGEEGDFTVNLARRDNNTEQSAVVSVVPVQCYLNGDIKFLANCLGKERMSGKHCYLCRLSAKQWSLANHDRGEQWSQHSLKHKWEEILIAIKTNQRTSPGFVNGVTGPALIDAVPVKNVGIPQLHIELGIGNQVLYKQLIDRWIVPFFVRLLDRIYQTRRAVYVAKKAIQNSPGSNINSEELKSLKTTLSEARKQHNEALKDVKVMNDPIMIHIEQEILLKYGIKRSSYHGGDPEGSACRALFSKASESLSEIRDYLKTLVPVYQISDEDIDSYFEANIRLLEHYDAIVALSRKIGISQQEIMTCGEHIRKFCRLWRVVGCSTEMVKFHLIEDHLIDALQEGNASRLKDSMEQFHQTAALFEKRSSTRDGEAKHKPFYNAEKRVTNPGVQSAVKETMDQTSRKRVRERNEHQCETSRLQKNQRRLDLLLQPELVGGEAFDADSYIINHLE